MSNSFMVLINDFSNTIENQLNIGEEENIQLAFDDGIDASISPQERGEFFAITAEFAPNMPSDNGLQQALAELLLQRNHLAVSDSRIMVMLTPDARVALVYMDRSSFFDGQSLFNQLELVINQARSLRDSLEMPAEVSDKTREFDYDPFQLNMIRG